MEAEDCHAGLALELGGPEGALEVIMPGMKQCY